MSRVRRIAAIVVCVAAGAYAIPATYTAADSMRLWVKSTVDEPWSGGKVWAVDTDFLEWTREQIPPGDHFLVIDGTGNPAVSQWTPFQLYPDVVTEDSSKADWMVLYGIYRGSAGAEVESFPDERVYADGFSLLGRKGVPTETEEDSDGS